MEYVSYSRKASAAVGQWIVAGFGTLWMIAWCLQQHGIDLAVLSLIVLAGTAISLAAWSQWRAGRGHPDTQVEVAMHKARGRAFLWINLAQWLALFAQGPCLAWLGHANWSQAAVMLIVGLHFLPLARVFKTRQHYLTGTALIAVALAYPWLGQGQSAYPAGCFATGAILWLSALLTFYRVGAGTGWPTSRTEALLG